jgi:hypothetical protein
LIWEKVHGPIPEGYEIHHVNGDGTDNRLENLVCLSASEHRLLHAKLRREGKDVVDDNTPGLMSNRNVTKRWLSNHKVEKKVYDAKWHLSHREEKNARSARWRKDHPGYSTVQRNKNKEKYIAIERAYALAHKEQRDVSMRKYRERNADLIRAKSALRAAIKRGSSKTKITELEHRVQRELIKREEAKSNGLQ